MRNWRDLFLIGCLIATAGSCALMAQADYIERPPEAYQKPNTVTVEFLSPEQATLRCFDRGLLIPAYACGSKTLVTLPNPCAFPGKYAELACHELARSPIRGIRWPYARPLERHCEGLRVGP